MLGQILYMIIACLFLLYLAPDIFGIPNSNQYGINDLDNEFVPE